MKFLKIALIVSFLFNLSFATPYVSKKLINRIGVKYDMFAKKRFFYLQKMLDAEKKSDERSKLRAVNQFFNDVRYKSDMKIYHRKDYWATPWEFLGKDMGDCEDYVISKYFALKYLGINPKKLFFTYVKSTKFKASHMVLTYFRTAHSEPLILDNNNRRIFPASKRKDLIPIYNFNGDTLYKKKRKKKKTHKKWDELQRNMKNNKI